MTAWAHEAHARYTAMNKPAVDGHGMNTVEIERLCDAVAFGSHDQPVTERKEDLAFGAQAVDEFDGAEPALISDGRDLPRVTIPLNNTHHHPAAGR